MTIKKCGDRLKFARIVEKGLFIIETNSFPYFNSKKVSVRIIREELKYEDDEISRGLLISVAHYLGSLVKALEIKGYVEKYSKRYWRRANSIPIEDNQLREEILSLANELRKAKNKKELLVTSGEE